MVEKRGKDDRTLPPETVACAPFHPPVSGQPLESQKVEFLDLLSNCFGYPVDYEQDSQLFYDIAEKYPEIDILEQTRKKIEWWRTHQKIISRSPRKQLNEWFGKEHEYLKKRRSSNWMPGKFNPYVGAQPPKPSDEEIALFPQWEAEYQTYLSEYMKKNGLNNQEEIDFTKRDVDTMTAFLSRKRREFQAKKD